MPARKIQEAIGASLDLDTVELIAESWESPIELGSAAEEARGVTESKHVYLAKHNVLCENKLNVVLEFAGLPTITHHLVLVLAAKSDGVGLTLISGCIVAIDAGWGARLAELRYSSTRLAASSSAWIALPTKRRLHRPVRIALNTGARTPAS